MTSDGNGGTTVIANPTQALFADGSLATDGNAVENQTVTVNLTDIDNGLDLGTPTYTWLEGGTIVQAGEGSSFTPGSNDVGQSLDVIVSFTDPTTHNVDQVTLVAGTIEAVAPPRDAWAFPAGGDFAEPTNWTEGAVPTSSDDAEIGIANPGTYTVTSGVFETVDSLQLGAGVTLDIADGNFTIRNPNVASAIDGTIELDGTSLNANGVTIDAGGKIIGSGQLSAEFNDSTHEIDNNGTIVATAPVGNATALEIDAPIFGTVDTPGVMEIAAGATLHLDSVILAPFNSGYESVEVSNQYIIFDDATGKLIVDGGEVDSYTLAAVVSGFVLGDDIDLTGVGSASGVGTADGWSFDGRTLSITSGSTTIATMFFNELAEDTQFTVGSDGNGGTDIAIGPPLPPPVDTWSGTGDWTNDAATGWSFGFSPGDGDAATIAGGVAQIESDLVLNDNAIQNNSEIDVGVTSGTTLALDDGTSITGGTLDVGPFGEVYVQNGTGLVGATLDGVTVNNDNEIGIGGPVGSTLILDGGTVISGGDLSLEDTDDLIKVETGGIGSGATLA